MWPRTTLAIGVALVTAGGIASTAGNSPSTSDTLPSVYRLTDVEFESTEGTGQDSMSIHVYGSGNGYVSGHSALKDDAPSPFVVESAEAFQLLQLCYRDGFFDLQPTYGEPNTVQLHADGTIETFTTIVADAAWSRVSVRIGTFKKSVAYLKGHGLPPPAVTELERRIKELATIGRRSDVH